MNSSYVALGSLDDEASITQHEKKSSLDFVKNIEKALKLQDYSLAIDNLMTNKKFLSANEINKVVKLFLTIQMRDNRLLMFFLDNFANQLDEKNLLLILFKIFQLNRIDSKNEINFTFLLNMQESRKKIIENSFCQLMWNLNLNEIQGLLSTLDEQREKIPIFKKKPNSTSDCCLRLFSLNYDSYNLIRNTGLQAQRYLNHLRICHKNM